MQHRWAVIAILAPLAGLAIPESVYAQLSPQRAQVAYDYNISQISPVNLDSTQIEDILNHKPPPNTANVLLNAYGQQTCTVTSDGLRSCSALAPVKVVQANEDTAKCRYLGVFHSLVVEPFFASYAACSLDLSVWTTLGVIDDVLKNEYGSQPDIRILPDNSVLFAEEYANIAANKLQIRVRYYGNRGAATGLQTFIANPSVTPTIEKILPNINNSSAADGTPAFGRIAYTTSIQKSQIEITHHYFYLGQRDIQAVGTLNDFNRWSDQTDAAMNQLITNAGGNGKIGDREVYRVGSTVYEVVEAQVNPTSPNDFGSWRLFLIDKTHNSAKQLNPDLGGAVSLGNPTISFVTVNGAPALVFTCFVFSENAGATPSGGHMYVYRLN